MCNALTVTKRKSAPLPERLCERIAYCAILLTVYEADYSVVVAQSEGADHRYYSTPEMQNILLQNAVGHAVRKAKNFAGGVTDTIFSGRPALINLMSDFVLDKTKATAEGHQWESYTLEHIANNARFAAGGQCDQCAGLLVDYQPFGSIPRCCNSLRIIRFIQAARESSPSCCCAFSIFSRKSGSKRNWNGGLPRLSFLCVDKLITPHVMYLCLMTHYTQSAQKAKPRKCRYHWQGL